MKNILDFFKFRKKLEFDTTDLKNKVEFITNILIILLKNRTESIVFVFNMINPLGIFDSASILIKNLVSKNILSEEKRIEDGYNSSYYTLAIKGIEIYDNIDKNKLILDTKIHLEGMRIKQTILNIIDKTLSKN